MADGTRPKSARPTLKTVAREAGVSTTTVSFVLSGRADAGISDATAQRVHEAVKRLGYFPNSSARAVRTGRTGLVMLSLNMLSDPWSLALADAVNSAAKKAGITSMILADGDWFSALELQSADVAYIGLGPDLEDDARKLATMVERGQKIVVFDEVLEPKGFDVIRSNSLPGCRIAIEHLLEHHTEIACLTSRVNARNNPSRLTVYRDAMADAGLGVREDRIGVYEETQAEAYAVALDLLSSPGPADGDLRDDRFRRHRGDQRCPSARHPGAGGRRRDRCRQHAGRGPHRAVALDGRPGRPVRADSRHHRQAGAGWAGRSR